MTAKEMKEEVRQYCLNLILNSTIENWTSNRTLSINNILIDYAYNQFNVAIYKDNTHSEKNEKITFDIYPSLFVWNKKERKENNLLKQKYKEIRTYFENKKEYEDAIETYNLLPLKELRKKKLEKIKDESQLDS